MGYTLKFEHPHFPPDQEFGINGLGVVKNGGTLEIDEDHEREFVVSQGRSIEDAYGTANGTTSLSGSSALSAEELKSLLPVVESNETDEHTDTSSPSSVPSNAVNNPPVVEEENEGGEN